MNDTSQFTPEQARNTLENYRSELQQWLSWLDSEAATLGTVKAPQQTTRSFSLLKQHLSMLKPWMQCMSLACPNRQPEDVQVTRWDSQGREKQPEFAYARVRPN